MLVKERMSHPVITTRPNTPIMEALDLMRKEEIRRLPVVDKRGRMIGIVSREDLLHAAPSDATSLSIWELHYLISKITVEKVMTTNVITIEEDTPLEESARIMADNKFGGLPVLRDDKVVGIITETDLFKIFLEMLGARERGVRLAAFVPTSRDELATLTKTIVDAGGNILALGTFLGETSENREIVMKIEDISVSSLQEVVQPFVERIVDIRKTS